MKLRQVRIVGYRSIREPLTLHVEPDVTVVLGANDHGKTNLLEALLHLNDDCPFDQERDLNWDCAKLANELPEVSFTFELSADEKGSIAKRVAELTLADRLDDEITQIEADALELWERAEEAASAVGAGETLVKELRAADAAAAQEPTEEASATLHDVEAQLAAAEREREEAEQGAQNKEFAGFLVRAIQQALLKQETLSALASKEHARTVDALAAAEAEEEAARTALAEARRTKARAESEGDDAAIDKAAKALTVRQQAFSQASETSGQLATDLGQWETVQQILGDPKDPRGTPVRELSKRLREVTPADVPSELLVTRKGVGSRREVSLPGITDSPRAIAHITSLLPRTELVVPTQRIQDDTDLDLLLEPESEFMRGIFYYAGLSQDEWDTIFDQDDPNQRRLQLASDQLNATLKENWSQGATLEFFLVHNSGKDRIDLRVNDPSVKARTVRASHRSSGFTHFFSLKTILYARQQERKAGSYIWLFDEPGVFLHPSGQFDMIQAVETLSQTSQIVYSTHSIFMLNKNDPSRHRMVVKDGPGTKLDSKPFLGSWRTALDSIGFSLPSTVLFASRVLLVEGDSDPILFNAIFQRLMKQGFIDYDINDLAIVATGQSRHTESLIRIMQSAYDPPKIAVLTDGDKGGKERLKDLEPVRDELSVPMRSLPTDLTTEDLVALPGNIILPATIRWATKITKRPAEEVEKAINESFMQRQEGEKGIADWMRNKAAEVVGMKEFSSVGLAREVAEEMGSESYSPTKSEWKNALSTVKWIAEQLQLQPRMLRTFQVLSEDASPDT